MNIKTEKNDLTTGVIWKKLLAFYMPILLGMLFQQMYNTVDAVVVGHFAGDGALAAVGGSAAVLTNLIIGFFVGLSGGATVIISQEFGADDRDTLSKTMHTAFSFAVIAGAVIMVLGILFSEQMLALVKNPEDIMKESTTYLRIYFTGSVPLLLYNLGAGALQAVGDSRRPLLYLICSSVINALLDILLVAVLKWGVAGAAAASAISMLICCVMLLCHLLRTDGAYGLELRKLGIDPKVLRRILRIGVPAGIQSSMYSISNIIIQTGVNSFGTLFVAAWTATGKLDGFYWVAVNALGVAVCAFAGQCFGAGKLDRMKSAVKLSMTIGLLATAAMSALLMAVARPAYSLFVESPVTVDYAVEAMSYFVPFYCIWTVIEILSAALRGAGETFVPMIIIIIGTCIVRVLWMLFAVPVWHTIMALSIIYPITWTITGTALIVYYYKGGWMKKALSNK